MSRNPPFTLLQAACALDALNALYSGCTMGAPPGMFNTEGCKALEDHVRGVRFDSYPKEELVAAMASERTHSLVWGYFNCFGKDHLTDEAQRGWNNDR